jgi:hypothetical protein
MSFKDPRVDVGDMLCNLLIIDSYADRRIFVPPRLNVVVFSLWSVIDTNVIIPVLNTFTSKI